MVQLLAPHTNLTINNAQGKNVHTVANESGKTTIANYLEPLIYGKN